MQSNSSASSTNPNDSAGARRSNPAFRQILAFVLALIWLLAIPLVFYVFHKPLPVPALQRARDALVDLLGAAWIFWTAAGMGWLFFRDAEFSLLERIALSEALGVGAEGILFLAVAWAGFFQRSVIFAALILLSIPSSVILIRTILRGAKSRPAAPASPRGFSLFLGFFIACSLLLALGIALCPPTAWDALVYHLQIPEQILAAHSLSLPGDSLFREMPMLVEMVYAAAFALTGRAETAAVAGWGIGLLALVGITGIARRWRLQHPLLPAALLVAGDTLARSMGWGYADWAAALFGAAALITLSRKDAGERWLFFAGVFAGFALGTKYTAGALLIVLCLALISLRQWRKCLKEAAILLAGCALAFSPWILRGLVVWGDAFPPIFDAGAAAALRLRFFNGTPLPSGWLVMAIVPILQSTIGAYGAWPFGVTIGPLLFAFLPGAFVRKEEEAAAGRFLLKLFWICAIVYWAAVGVGGLFSVSLTQPRVYLALFPGIALLSARGFEGLWKIRLMKVRLGALAAVLTVLALGVQAVSFANSWIAAGIPDYLAGAQSEQEFLENNLGWYSRAMAAVQSLPPGAHVLMLWEPRGFYCADKCLADANIDRWYLAMRIKGSMENTLEQWRENGWTYVLIFNSGAEFERAGRVEYSASDWASLDRLRAILEPVEDFGGAYTLYAVPKNPWREP